MLADKAHCDVEIAESALKGKQQLVHYIKNVITENEKAAECQDAEMEEIKRIVDEVKSVNQKSKENEETIQKAINILSGVSESSPFSSNLKKRSIRKKLTRRHNRRRNRGRHARKCWGRVKRRHHKKKHRQQEKHFQTDKNIED